MLGRGAGRRQRALGGAKCDPAYAGASAHQREAGVLALLPHGRHVLDPGRGHHQHGLGVAGAEGAETLELLGEVEAERATGHDGVHVLHAQQVGGSQPLARVCR